MQRKKDISLLDDGKSNGKSKQKGDEKIGELSFWKDQIQGRFVGLDNDNYLE